MQSSVLLRVDVVHCALQLVMSEHYVLSVHEIPDPSLRSASGEVLRTTAAS